MKKFKLKHIKKLEAFILKDDDFFNTYEDIIKSLCNSLPSMVSDFIIEGVDPWRDKNKLRSHYERMVKSFALSVYHDYTMEGYVYDFMPYGTSWLKIDDNLYLDIDYIYLDFQSYLKG